MSSVVDLQSSRLVDGLTFGEGPRWHDGRLWFTDGPTGKVRSLGAGGDLRVEVETSHPSGLGWLPDGRLVICTMQEAAIKRVDPDGVTLMHDLSHLAWSTNDMVVGPDGRIYVDLYQLTDDGITGQIALITPAGDITIVAADLAVPNGLGIVPDGSTLLVSETFGSKVLAFPIGPDGTLGERLVFADLGPQRHPDGLCIDAEGGVWIGCYDTNEFLRVLDGGEITHRVRTDAGWAVAPMLGGADRRTLYLIVNDSTHEKLPLGESVGCIEHVRVDVPGAGWP